MVYIVCAPQAKIFGSTLRMHIYIVIPESHGTVHHMHMCAGSTMCTRATCSVFVKPQYMCNYLYRVSADAYGGWRPQRQIIAGLLGMV